MPRIKRDPIDDYLTERMMTDYDFEVTVEPVKSVTYAGALQVGDVYYIQYLKKPSRWVLFWHRVLLGWKWREDK